MFDCQSEDFFPCLFHSDLKIAGICLRGFVISRIPRNCNFNRDEACIGVHFPYICRSYNILCINILQSLAFCIDCNIYILLIYNLINISLLSDNILINNCYRYIQVNIAETGLSIFTTISHKKAANTKARSFRPGFLVNLYFFMSCAILSV